MELAELGAHPTVLKGLALAANVAVVAFLLWSLWRSRRSPGP
jgi:uncharacterized membrane protein (DUF2068 family)